MNRFLRYAFFALFLPLGLSAQPMPCGTPAAMTSTCIPACVVCDINGFTGRNNSNVQGQAPPGFCTTVVHHMQWIAFIAGSTNLTLRVDVFNCAQGQGLEIGIYQTSDCQTFTLVSNCNTNALNNNAAIFTNTVPLVVGQHYYFVMDGSANDICNYTVTVVSGSTQVAPLTSSGAIEGPDIVCPGSRASFSTPGQTGAVNYNWTLNGAPAGNGRNIDYSFPTTPGSYQLCLNAANACSMAPPSCRTITVPAIPVTNLSSAICPGECTAVADTLICSPGLYERRFQAASGCDSLVRITVTEAPDVVTNLNLFICEGDTLFVAGNPYTQSGRFQNILMAANGCDSVINLDLTVVICEIQARIEAVPVSCLGVTDGMLTFGVTNGTPPFTYTWSRIGQAIPAGMGNLNTVGELDTLTVLPPGQYIITIKDLFGNDVILLAEIIEPPALDAVAATSSFNGFGVSCYGSSDGWLQAVASGGTPPYAYAWSNGGNVFEIRQLTQGNYDLTVTDARGCSIRRNASLTEPDSISVAAVFTNPGCDGPATGAIDIALTTGGVAPYTYALRNGPFNTAGNFAGLAEGNYAVSVRDANGCIAMISGNLIAAAIPVIELGGDLVIDLGESIRMNAVANMPLFDILWSPAAGLSCTDCLQTDAMPVRTTTYTFSGSSTDGCVNVDSITVLVLNNRDVFVPNAFSPNDDGINDRLTLFGGPEVLQIRLFRVFSRWGELVFERRDFPANEESLGWDGRFKGKPMSPGVYAWFAEIAFIDGVSVIYEGEFVIVK